jgi:hypothetical protein
MKTISTLLIITAVIILTIASTYRNNKMLEAYEKYDECMMNQYGMSGAEYYSTHNGNLADCNK